jgi:TP901 family phage tail tape measure protein
LFDAGAIVGRMELALDGWKKSVETVKADQQSMTGFAMRHSDEIQNLGKNFLIAGAAITAALTAITIQAANAGDKFDEMSAKTGISTEILSTLKLAADKSGTSIESVAQGMKFLASEMLATSTAGDKSKTVLGALGISATDADGKLRPMNDVLFDVAEKFKGMEDGAVKVKLAVALFGRAGMDMIPILNLGSNGLKENEEAARKLGIEWSGPSTKAAAAFDDAMKDLKAAGTGLSKTIGEALMPIIKDLVEKVTAVVVKVREWAEAHPELAKGITILIGSLGLMMTTLGTTLIAVVKLSQAILIMKTTSALPIYITIVLVGAALATAGLLKLREEYEKHVSHKWVDDATKKWADFSMAMGGWTTVAEKVTAVLYKQDGDWKAHDKVLQQLKDSFDQLGETATYQAIAAGKYGPAVADAFSKMGGAQLEAALAASQHTDATGKQTAAIGKLDPALQALIDSLDKGKDKTKTLAENLRALANDTDATHPAITKLDAALHAAMATGTLTSAELKPIAERLIELKVQAGEVVPVWLKFMAGLSDTALPASRLGAESSTLSKILADLGGVTLGLSAKLADTILPISRNTEVLNALTNSAGIAGAAFNAFGNNLKISLAQGIASFMQLDNAGALSKDELTKAADDIVAKAKAMGIAFSDLPKAVRDASTKMTTNWDDFSKNMVQLWTQGLSQMLSSTTDTASKINAVIKLLAQTAGLAITAVLTPVVGKEMASAIGGLAAMALSLFGVKSSAEKAAAALKDFKKGFEELDPVTGKLLQISDETGKRLQDLTKKFGAAGAEARMLGQIMKDTGINADNFAWYVSKATNTLTLMASGMLDTKTGIAAADDAFIELIDAAKRLGTEGTPELINFIKTSREMGLQIASVTKYVDEQLGVVRTGSKSAADGLLAMAQAIAPSSTALVDANVALKASLQGVLDKMAGMDPASDEYRKLKADADEYSKAIKANEDATKQLAINSVDGLKRVENQTLAVFNAMIANGASAAEAEESIGPALDVIIQKHKELGIAVDPAIEKLLHIRDVTESHKELMSAIEGNDAVLKALGNTGFLNAEALKAATDNAGDYYNQLIAAGMDGDEALAMMGPTLSDIDEYAKTYGLTLDDNTLKMIEAAKKAGIIKEKVDMGAEAKKTNDLLTDMRDIFAAIAEKLGIVLDKIGLIPKNIKTTVDVEYNDPGLPGESGAAGSTTKGKLDTYDLGGYVPRTGPAILHAGEFVLSPDMISGRNGGSQPGISSVITGGDTTIHFHGPFVSTYGAISRADIQRAGEDMFAEIEAQAGRHNKKFSHA